MEAFFVRAVFQSFKMGAVSSTVTWPIFLCAHWMAVCDDMRPGICFKKTAGSASVISAGPRERWSELKLMPFPALTGKLLPLLRPGSHSARPDPWTRTAVARSRGRLLRASTRGVTLCVRGPHPPGRRASGTSSGVPAGSWRRRTFIPCLMMMRRRAAVVSLKHPGRPNQSLMTARRRNNS